MPSQKGNSELNRSHPQRVTEERLAMTQEIRHCYDSPLYMGLPEAMSRKQAGKE
jgi:hypothetical protein